MADFGQKAPDKISGDQSPTACKRQPGLTRAPPRSIVVVVMIPVHMHACCGFWCLGGGARDRCGGVAEISDFGADFLEVDTRSMPDGHGAVHHGNRHVLDAGDPACCRVDFGSTGGAIHAFHTKACRICSRVHTTDSLQSLIVAYILQWL